MKKIYQLISLAVILFSGVITSCNESIPEYVAPIYTPAEVQNFLIDGKWHLEKCTFTDGKIDSIQAKTLTDCDKQSYLSFERGNSTTNASYTSYNACTPKSTTGIYSLNYSGATIKLGGTLWAISFDDSKERMYLMRGASGSRLAVSESRVYVKRQN